MGKHFILEVWFQKENDVALRKIKLRKEKFCLSD